MTAQGEDPLAPRGADCRTRDVPDMRGLPVVRGSQSLFFLVQILKFLHFHRREGRWLFLAVFQLGIEQTQPVGEVRMICHAVEVLEQK